ncbi:hypothetical protein ACLOJK_008738 [Asimina triloba]
MIIPLTTTKIITFITVAIMNMPACDPIANTNTSTHIIGFEILNPNSIASPTSDNVMNITTITKKNGENRRFVEETRGKTEENEGNPYTKRQVAVIRRLGNADDPSSQRCRCRQWLDGWLKEMGHRRASISLSTMQIRGEGGEGGEGDDESTTYPTSGKPWQSWLASLSHGNGEEIGVNRLCIAIAEKMSSGGERKNG